jgi:hypothetical protein
MGNNQPQWLKEAPKWFQEFYSNDFSHLKWKVDMTVKIQYVILAAIVGFALTICLRGI